MIVHERDGKMLYLWCDALECESQLSISGYGDWATDAALLAAARAAGWKADDADGPHYCPEHVPVSQGKGGGRLTMTKTREDLQVAFVTAVNALNVVMVAMSRAMDALDDAKLALDEVDAAAQAALDALNAGPREMEWITEETR